MTYTWTEKADHLSPGWAHFLYHEDRPDWWDAVFCTNDWSYLIREVPHIHRDLNSGYLPKQIHGDIDACRGYVLTILRLGEQSS